MSGNELEPTSSEAPARRVGPSGSRVPTSNGPARRSPTAIGSGSGDSTSSGPSNRGVPRSTGAAIRNALSSTGMAVSSAASAAGAPTPGQSRPGTRPGARRVRLTITHIDPWSAMKVGFLVSVALCIAGVMMTLVLWTLLKLMGVFDQVNDMVAQIMGDSSANSTFQLMDFIGFWQSLSLALLIGILNIVLMTALSALGAFLYNVCVGLVGGVQLTFTDD